MWSSTLELSTEAPAAGGWSPAGDSDVEGPRRVVLPGGGSIRIGDTPMRTIALTVAGATHVVHLKLEGANPGGSIKDRTALGLLDGLEAAGRLQDDSILLESTSGNLGVALAMLARCSGHEFVAVIDPKITEENLERLRQLGARIEMVHDMDVNGGYLLSRLARVKELCRASPRVIWTDQYANSANPRMHYRQTAPEILGQVDDALDVIFVAVSTGGTLSGIARRLRERSPRTRIVAVDARGSVALGGSPGPRHLSGIGSSRMSTFVTARDHDELFYVSDGDAFAFCRYLRVATGIAVGGSSGAVLAACARYLAAHEVGGSIVCVCPDRGESYDSSIFDDAWLRAHGCDPDARPALVTDMRSLV